MKKLYTLSFLIIAICMQNANASSYIWVDPDNNQCDQTSSRIFCTISTAIDNASSSDSIVIAGGEYKENLRISKNLRLIGDTETTSVINANHKGSGISISPGIVAYIINLIIKNGNAINGGGIMNKGQLYLSNSIVKNNIATLSGGGIYNEKSLTGGLNIDNSEIINNLALGDDPYNVKYGGGGIFNNSPLHITNSLISDNHTADNGGGIYSIYSGRKRASHGQLVAEKIGIAAAPKRNNTLSRKSDIGAVSLHGVTITHNISSSGGGINLQGVMKIKKSIIRDNQAIKNKRSAGGGIFAHLDTSLIIENSIVARNVASFRGAGIRLFSSRYGKFYNVSILDNELISPFGQGAGLYIENHTKSFSIKNSVIARNFSPNKTHSDCYGKIQSQGFNFIGSTQNCAWTKSNGDITSKRRAISPSIIWRDQKQRYLLTANSPLIDRANSFGCKDENDKLFESDYYGMPRHINAKNTKISRCDIGAVEYVANFQGLSDAHLNP